MEQLDFIRNAGETRRFHTWPVLRQQNVAEHSWHVTMLLWFIFGNIEPGIPLPVLMAALTHDAAEWQVGDIPSPAKRGMEKIMPDFRERWGVMEEEILAQQGWDWDYTLTDEQRAMIKLCDSMDGAFYCVRERAMGNKLIEPCYRNFINYVEELLIRHFPPAPDSVPRQVYAHIKDMWEQADAS
jgi:5'-deoxynucleotidase YfbR-like HD superfamily hydrolase